MTLSQHVKELLDQFYETTSLHFNLKGCYAISINLLVNEPEASC